MTASTTSPDNPLIKWTEKSTPFTYKQNKNNQQKQSKGLELFIGTLVKCVFAGSA